MGEAGKVGLIISPTRGDLAGHKPRNQVLDGEPGLDRQDGVSLAENSLHTVLSVNGDCRHYREHHVPLQKTRFLEWHVVRLVRQVGAVLLLGRLAERLGHSCLKRVLVTQRVARRTRPPRLAEFYSCFEMSISQFKPHCPSRSMVGRALVDMGADCQLATRIALLF